MNDDTPRLAHGSVQALLSETIVAIFALLDEACDSAHVRELRAKARSYERIVAMWASVPPSAAQRDATFDPVTELHLKAAEVKLDVAYGDANSRGSKRSSAATSPLVDRSRRRLPPDER
jgi:hypothetical protein